MQSSHGGGYGSPLSQRSPISSISSLQVAEVRSSLLPSGIIPVNRIPAACCSAASHVENRWIGRGLCINEFSDLAFEYSITIVQQGVDLVTDIHVVGRLLITPTLQQL